MLKKLEFYYNEDNEKIDISDEKIYWDTIENVFRHKFDCKDCGKHLGCHCFGHLYSIIEAIECGYQCNKCFILDTWNDEEEYAIDVAEDVDKLHPEQGDFKKRVEIMQYLRNQDGNFETTEISEKCEEIADMIYGELLKELKSLPDDDFKFIGYNGDYDSYDGYSCEL